MTIKIDLHKALITLGLAFFVAIAVSASLEFIELRERVEVAEERVDLQSEVLLGLLEALYGDVEREIGI